MLQNFSFLLNVNAGGYLKELRVLMPCSMCVAQYRVHCNKNLFVAVVVFSMQLAASHIGDVERFSTSSFSLSVLGHGHHGKDHVER
jgi:hypothetical protein